MPTTMLQQFSTVLAERTGPCLSLYLPTERRFPEQKQNLIRFKNRVRVAEHSFASLDTPLTDTQLESLMAPLHELATNDRFWHHTHDGLAIFRAPDFFKVYKLQRTVPERTIVADSFHVKPLMRVLQSPNRFEVLALTREHVRLFHGDSDRLDEVELDAHVPLSIEAALGDELTEPHSSVRPLSNRGGTGGAGGGGSAVHYGSGSKHDEIDKDTERFFRVVDRAIHEHHSKSSALPLVLAALPEYHARFRETSHNPQLVHEAIVGNPDAFSVDDLRDKAWAIVQPRFAARLEKLVSDYSANLAHGLASDDLSDVAVATLRGRVKALLVDADRVVPGSVNRETGQITLGKLADAHTDDVIDDLAELAMRQGGDVVVVPHDRMPSITGVAAVYRF